jgi:hypothetical protein
VYFAPESIFGNTFVSDAAASTVAPGPLVLDGVLEDELLADAAGCAPVELDELLLPQPAARADTAVTMVAAQMRRDKNELKGIPSLYERQNPGTLPESWRR